MLQRLLQYYNWTKIENIKIEYTYYIEYQEGNKSTETSSVIISADEIKQGRHNKKDWSLKREKQDQIIEMISNAKSKNPYKSVSDNGKDLRITAVLLTKHRVECTMQLICKFGDSYVNVEINVYLAGNRLSQVDFSGDVNGSEFKWRSLQLNNEQYSGYGFAHIMVMLFGCSIPFLEQSTGVSLRSISGSIGDSRSDNKEKSIPFYKSLSGTVLPFGEKLILIEEPYLSELKLRYKVE